MMHLTDHTHVFNRANPLINNIQRHDEAHLEEVILMYHTTVGQVLDQSVGEGGFPSICYAVRNKIKIEWDYK